MDADTPNWVRWVWTFHLSEFHPNKDMSAGIFADIVNRYSEPTRHYHNFGHVVEVLLSTWDLLGPFCASPPYLAAILHDVIYDARAKDNEERSAEYANDRLTTLGVPREVREETSRLILLTKIHEVPKEDLVACALIDADLGILAANEKRYDDYAAAIRREYDWVPDADFRVGRSRVLHQFLARRQIYRTKQCHERWEPQARANLAREIAALEGSR